MSDSTLIFKAGARTFVEMEDDFKGLATPGHLLQQYARLKQEALWGGNLHSLVEASLELITDTVNQSQDPSQLEIDMVFVWMGNELCGRRGVFIDPGTPQWQIEQIGPEGLAAEGIWSEIAARVCGLRRDWSYSRPSGQAGDRQHSAPWRRRPDRLWTPSGVPRSYPKIPWITIAPAGCTQRASRKQLVAAIPTHDHYLFREDSSRRATLANVIAHRVHICPADFMFSKVRAKHLDVPVRMYPYDKSGTRVFGMAYVFDKARSEPISPAALKGRPKSWKQPKSAQTRGKAAESLLRTNL